MEQTKLFCDLCEREIIVDWYEIEVKSKKNRGHAGNSVTKKDTCKKCWEIIEAVSQSFKESREFFKK